VRRLGELYEKLIASFVTLSGGEVIVWIGSFSLMMASFVSWFAWPLQGRVPGYAFPLLGGVSLSGETTPPIRFFSFGIACFILGLVGGVCEWRQFPKRVVFIIGGFSVLLSYYFFLDLIFVHPETIESAAIQLNEKLGMSRFGEKHLEGNSTATQEDAPLTMNGLLDRVAGGFRLTGLTEVGLGWRWALISGLLIQLGAYWAKPSRKLLGDIFWMAFLALVMTVGLSWKAIAGEYYRVSGDRQLAEGAFEKAIYNYGRARKWDPSFMENAHYSYNLGSAIYRLRGLEDADAHVYIGDNHQSRHDYLDAMVAYKTALMLYPGHAVATRKVSETLVTMGLLAYNSDALSAVSKWEEALSFTPNSIEPHFYLAHTFFGVDRNSQARAIQENNFLLTRIMDKLLRADIYNNLGNCYYKQGDFNMAREMFNRSLRQFQLVKKVINFNAFSGLQGK